MNSLLAKIQTIQEKLEMFEYDVNQCSFIHKDLEQLKVMVKESYTSSSEEKNDRKNDR